MTKYIPYTLADNFVVWWFFLMCIEMKSKLNLKERFCPCPNVPLRPGSVPRGMASYGVCVLVWFINILELSWPQKPKTFDI